MKIVTPTEIESVAWEGDLAAPTVSFGPKSPTRLTATIGKPAIWAVADALENEVGQKWTPPLGNADYWLVRLACTLRDPSGMQTITAAQQRLYLRPQNHQADDDTTYALSLFPDRLGVEDKGEISASLGPEMKFAGGSEFKVGQLGAKIECRKVFPVIQSYGAGESAPYWVFKPHAAHPIEGSQFVYAVVAAKAGSGGIQAYVELVATVEARLGGLIRLGTPEEVRPYTKFTIP